MTQTIQVTSKTGTVPRGDVYTTTIVHDVVSDDASYSAETKFTLGKELIVYLQSPCTEK
jgi:hypothetical protein